MVTIADLVARQDYIRRAHVTEPGFERLYVRVRGRPGSGLGSVIVLADAVAQDPGQGALTALLDRLERDYPGFAVSCENVLEERLAQYLARRGFKGERPDFVPERYLPSSWWRPPVMLPRGQALLTDAEDY